MKSITTLIKLMKRRVDQQRLRISQTQYRLAQVEQKITDLRAQQRQESAYAARSSPMVSVTYGKYAQTLLPRYAELEKERGRIETVYQQEQKRLEQLFREQKILEVYADRKQRAHLLRQEKQTQQQLDDVARIVASLGEDPEV